MSIKVVQILHSKVGKFLWLHYSMRKFSEMGWENPQEFTVVGSSHNHGEVGRKSCLYCKRSPLWKSPGSLEKAPSLEKVSFPGKGLLP